MSRPQVETFTACRLAFRGTERRRQAAGEERVSAAAAKCLGDFWRLDDWWPVYVKLWSLYEQPDKDDG